MSLHQNFVKRYNKKSYDLKHIEHTVVITLENMALIQYLCHSFLKALLEGILRLSLTYLLQAKIVCDAYNFSVF